jgi:hypothetical protein
MSTKDTPDGIGKQPVGRDDAIDLSAYLTRIGYDLPPLWRTPLLAHAAKAVTSNWAGLR